jgi:hypothetical protein
MNLRLLLRASGVSARDLEEAIASSREVTRYAALGAEMLAKGLQKASPRLQSEMAREIARKGAFLAAKIQDGAEVMLREGAHAPPKPPLEEKPKRMTAKKPQKIEVQIIEKKR